MRSHLLRVYIAGFHALLLISLISACSNPEIQTYQYELHNKTDHSTPYFSQSSIVTPDKYQLPLKVWQPKTNPEAVVLALHGFNDYRYAFNDVAIEFSQHAIISYAFDQRGFGETVQHGVWAGSGRLQSDLITTLDLLCAKHSGLPVYVLGESMGGAVILSAMQRLQGTCVSGVILMAPAVWGWQVMPWWQTLPLRLLAHTLPETTVTGEGLEIRASDNEEMLRALGRDPLIIKETRIDAIYGLTDLMEAALMNSENLNLPALILYGERDEIIPPDAFCELITRLPNNSKSALRLVLYPEGYHMLSRDLQAEVVIRDMLSWIQDQNAALPSKQEIHPGSDRLLVFDDCE